MFLLPTLFFFVGYQVYPILRVLWISFTDYKFLRHEPANWVGLRELAERAGRPAHVTRAAAGGEFTLMFLPGTIILPLLLAILVDRVEPAAGGVLSGRSC